jgi:hypothetical protein
MAATPRRKPAPAEPDLSSQSDFQLLNYLTSLASKENSQQLTAIIWEVMRRYTAALVDQPPAPTKDYSASLGDARWGDAKRVETIFGIKRGVLRGLVDKDLIKSKVLGGEGDSSGASTNKKAKRLYSLVSILEYLDQFNQIPHSP